MNDKNTLIEIKPVNIKMPIEMYKEIEEMAETSQRTVSGQIRFMLQEYINLKKTK